MSRYAPKGVFTKALYDRRWFIIGWFVGLAFLAWFIGVFYGSFGQSEALNEQLKSLPPELQSLVGTTDSYSTVPGYFGTQIFSQTMTLLSAVLGIMLGTSLAVEEENGTLQTLLAAPLSRTKVVLSKWLAAVVTLGIVVLGLVPGLAISLWQQSLSLDVWKVSQALLNVWVFCIFFLSLTFAVAAIWGRKAYAIAVSSIVAVSGYLLFIMSAGVKSLKPYEKLSVYFYYGTENVLEKGVVWWRLSSLVVASIVLLVVSAVVFARRDIASA
jgi:ABC-2 type transport system permease protein